MASLQVAVTQADHAKGRPDAPVTLVEYGDYECPHCRAAYPVVQQLQKRFGADLRFVYRNFPLSEIHPNALSAAMTAEFGASHGRFWNVHDGLFKNQQKLGAPLYQAIVTELQLDAAKLRAALEANTYLERVRADFNGGVRSGVNGTPAFFVNGKRYEGAPDFETMAGMLGEAIRIVKANASRG